MDRHGRDILIPKIEMGKEKTKTKKQKTVAGPKSVQNQTRKITLNLKVEDHLLGLPVPYPEHAEMGLIYWGWTPKAFMILGNVQRTEIL